MISERLFGICPCGSEIKEYTLSGGDIEVKVISYGGAIRSIKAPDKNGCIQDVVLGYDTLDGYIQGKLYFGSLVGRYANRIKSSSFTLADKSYRLVPNEGKNHLHGVFTHKVMNSCISGNSVVMTLVSPPEDEGYPGTLSLKLTYTLSDENGLVIDYEATTDCDTVVNLTNHSYFNLSGQHGGGAEVHDITMTADRFTQIDGELIPTGEIQSVEGTALDMRCGINIAEGLARFGRGYDHNLIFPDGEGFRRFAEVYSSESGIKMEAFTTEPAVQFYVKSRTDGMPHGEKNPYQWAFCLEAQHYPASPSYEHFPTTVLKKGEVYRQRTEYRLSLL